VGLQYLCRRRWERRGGQEGYERGFLQALFGACLGLVWAFGGRLARIEGRGAGRARSRLALSVDLRRSRDHQERAQRAGERQAAKWPPGFRPVGQERARSGRSSLKAR